MAGARGSHAICLPMRSASASCLALGLRWMPVLEGEPLAQLRRRARVAGATHYVLGAAGMGGWARVPSARRKTAVYSAALAYARLHPLGSSVTCVPLPDGRVWVAAAHAGAVLVDADKICADESQAAAWCAALMVRFPQMTNTSVTFDDLALATSEDTRLIQRTGVWRRLPAPLKVMPFVLMAAYGIEHGGSVWQILTGPASEAVKIDPEIAWTQAQAQVAGEHPIHGVDDMRAVLSGLAGLPTNVAGWALHGANCLSELSAWRCRADYARVSHVARNADLARRVPEDWQADFGLLDQAVLSWRVANDGHSLAELDVAVLPRGRDTDLVYASRLQAIRPAFGLISVGKASDLAVTTPSDAEGVPLARPADLPWLRTRGFSVQGPLRSYALLTESPPPMAWRELSLALIPDAEAGIALSRLVVRLQGVIYEQR